MGKRTQPFSITTFPSVVVELKALQSKGTSLFDNNRTTQLRVVIFKFHAFYFHRLPDLFSFLFSPTSFIARVSREKKIVLTSGERGHDF